MKNRNTKSGTYNHVPAYATRDVDMLKARNKRNLKQRYEERHNCDEYVAHFNAYGMEVEYDG
jgi:hypothetical protein